MLPMDCTESSRSLTSKTVNVQNTPFTNHRVSLHQLKKGGRSTEALKLLEVLLKQSWNAFSVSPLFTWSNRETRLKRFSRRVSNFLAESLPIEDGDKFDVQYKIDENLKFSVNDNPSVKITVNISHDDAFREVFLGYLLSWGCPKVTRCSELDGIPYLPVFLCSGSKKVGGQVRRAMERIHDCVISSLELRESDRKELWMALLSYLKNEDETLTISYMIPNHPKVGLMQLKISSNVTTKLARLIYKKCDGNVSYEEISLFWNEINEQVNDIFGVKVQYCEMVRLEMKQAVVAADKFRANSTKAMHAILIFLTNMSVKLESPIDGIEKV